MLDELPTAEDIEIEERIKELTSEEGNLRILIAKFLCTILNSGIGEETNKLLEENRNNKEFISLAKTMLELHNYTRY
jgi:hypothetical protein